MINHNLFFLLLLSSFPVLGQNLVWPAGHAHNDYHHEQPLFDALHFGFNSVEADVWLRGDTLFVAHDSIDIDSCRRLENLYIHPLSELVHANSGYVQSDSLAFILLIDIKSDSLKTYLAIDRLLSCYDSVFTVYKQSGAVCPRAIKAVISGNRPRQYMRQQQVRHATYDGRLSDLDSPDPLSLMWLISDNASRLFHWRGEGNFPESDRTFLGTTVQSVHQQGRKLRFWALWDQPGEARHQQWELLGAAGVDLISTDDLSGFDAWCRSR